MLGPPTGEPEHEGMGIGWEGRRGVDCSVGGSGGEGSPEIAFVVGGGMVVGEMGSDMLTMIGRCGVDALVTVE